MSEQEKYPYLAKLPRRVFTEGELHLTEYGRRVIESLPVERNEWDEVCQICGESLCVRLDWRDPEMAKHKLEQIRSTVKDAFERAYGIYKPDSTEPAKEQERG